MPNIIIAESLDMDTLQAFAAQHKAFLHIHAPAPAGAAPGEFHLSYQPDIEADDIAAEIEPYDALVVRPKIATSRTIRAGKNLKIIVRGGAGMNSIDLVTAKECGVVVENTPGENSVSTAEFTFAMLMELVARRQMLRAADDTRRGNPGTVESYQGQELAGKKIGIVGMGYIGKAVAKRAAAFDMEVSYVTRTPQNLPYTRYDSLHELLAAEMDVVSLHMPVLPETNQCIGAAEFALMKPGTILINCARPQLVQAEAFGEALRHGTLASAGIDGDMDLIEPFIKADPENRCILTHHIADSTKQAQEKITRAVLGQLWAYFMEGREINRVV